MDHPLNRNPQVRPLVEIAGRVIGMNTAIFSQSGGYQGIGFAIPINMAKGIVEDPSVLKNLLEQQKVDSNVPLTVIRNGKNKTLQVTIGELASEEQAGKSRKDSLKNAPLGIQIQELTPDIAAQLGYKNEKGVVVAGVQSGSPAAGANIRRGDLIQEINQTPVESVSAYQKAVSKGEKFLFLIRRDDNTFFTVIKPEK
jgi:S1-C subfamily serine protease